MKFIKIFEKSLWVTASQAAEKLKFLSFRGTLRAEESLILLTLEPRGIPHFVRNDKIAYFFRSYFSGDMNASLSSASAADAFVCLQTRQGLKPRYSNH